MTNVRQILEAILFVAEEPVTAEELAYGGFCSDYVAGVDSAGQCTFTLDAAGSASVELEAVAPAHPFCNINMTDNIVQFTSDRYSANPLVVQGPGAGPEVTAAGVFADLLRLANYLSTGEGYV